jgi:hypothetical protein
MILSKGGIMKLIKYKLRAECMIDIVRLIEKIMPKKNKKVGYFKIIPDEHFPDCELVFTTTLTIHELRAEIRKIVDSHVMLQTLEFFANYTGNRTTIE